MSRLGFLVSLSFVLVLLAPRAGFCDDAKEILLAGVLGQPHAPDKINLTSRGSMAPEDQRFAQALKIRLSTEDRLYAFYESRRFAPLWFKNAEPLPQAEELLALVERVPDEGLVGRDYSDFLPRLHRSAVGLEGSYLLGLQDQVDYELALSSILLHLLIAQRYGQVAPEHRPFDVGYTPVVPSPKTLLDAYAHTRDPEQLFVDFTPSHPLYAFLKDELADVTRAEAHWRVEDRGLRSCSVDKARQTPVFRLEQNAHSRADASLMSESLTDLRHEIVANMEMVRWIPDEIRNSYVWVNIPEFRVRIASAGKPVYTGKVIVGKASKPSPIFNAQMNWLVVNPYWNVPASILKSSFLPKFNEGAPMKETYEIVSRDGEVVPYDEETFDWSGFQGKGYRLRQMPGPTNALGSIKFIFPNDYSVYLHDTPNKGLFSLKSRAFSSGCIRLEEPWVVADEITSMQSKISYERVERVRGGSSESWFTLDQSVPFLTTYLTVTPHDGHWQRHSDLYGHIASLRSLLSDSQ